MSDDRGLAASAIEADLFGPDALLHGGDVSAPDGYSLVRELGSGGAGTVWLARDLRLDRPVALKFLSASDPQVVERFRREARFTARLCNPSIVRVYEMGEHAGRAYISMEYVDGGSLAASALSHRRLAEVVLEVSRALRHAHASGIVHRDIKPENILLDARGRACITDFGIARELFGSVDPGLSTEGQILGTPACMSPEQARGDLHAVDARSDVYSLGATLFRKLTGRWPFEGDSVVDLLHAVIHRPPPMPRSFDPSIPRALESICMTCLRKDRNARYRSMAELGEALETYLAGGRSDAESDPWFRKLVHHMTGREPEPAASSTSDDPYWTLGMEVAGEIAAFDADLYRVSRNVHERMARLEAVAARLDRHLADRPESAWARYYKGAALFRCGRLEEALEEMERAIDRAARLPGAWFELGRLYLAFHLRHQRRARKHLTPGGVRHDLERGGDLLAQSIAAFHEARRLDPDTPDWRLAFAEAVGRLAEDDFAGCVEVCDRILADDPDVEQVWRLRGDALRFSGGDPFASYDRALEIRRGAFDTWIAKAEAQVERGNLAGSRASLERALSIHPLCSDARALLARVHMMEALERGEPPPEEAVALVDALLDREPDHYEALVTRAELRIAEADAAAASDGAPAAIESGLLDLERARGVVGCQNRVALVRARLLLLRATDARRSPGERRADLDRAVAGAPPRDVPPEDLGPWPAILERASAAREALDGGPVGA